MVLLKKVSKFQQGSRIRNLFLVEINAHERPHGIVVINGIFNGNIRQIEPDLHKVHAKHRLNAFYGTTTLSGRIEWQNHRNPCGPWNHGIHSIEEFFAACLLWALIVFEVCERLLFHEKIPPFITCFICCLYFTGKIYLRREILDEISVSFLVKSFLWSRQCTRQCKKAVLILW